MNKDVKIRGKSSITAAFFSFLSGIFNGMLGAGGGIIFVFLLNYLRGNDAETAKSNFATTTAAIAVMSLFSALSYMENGNVDLQKLVLYIPSAIAGGLFGAFLLDKINVGLLKKIFAVLIVYSGITLILR